MKLNINMKENLNKIFLQITDKYPNASSFICFEKLIKDRKLTKTEVLKYFNKFVEKDDYLGCGKAVLVDYCHKYSNGKLDHIGKKKNA